MAIRTSPGRSIPGNPLGGVLRHLDTRARIAGRTRVTGAPDEGAEPAAQRTVPAQAPGRAAGAVLTTGEDGRARWEFPAPYGGVPAVAVVPVDPDPGDDERTVTAALEEVTAWCVTVRVWRTRARRGTGVVEPAGPGVTVHVTALDTSPA
ncbi:hypothetical protein OG234_13115 [Streptomyces sp. NBC_01420]|uniref:hypothetical protein n=1 Tax=Streptomyces sp. NBC_01420 TaxID=2903858 RepID=UPI00325439F2